VKWLQRCCWLAAWSVWLWLGVGLYRELPREVGPAVCKIPFTSCVTRAYGFDGPSRLVVGDLRKGAPKTAGLYDTENGDCIARFPMPNVEWNLSWADSAMHHRHVVVKQRDQGWLQALDLADGVCHTICPDRVLGFAVHPAEPVVAFTASTDKLSDQRLAVYDLKTHRLLFETVVTERKRTLNRLFFIPGTDKLVVMGSFRGSYRPSDGTTVFICTIPRLGGQSKVEEFDVALPRLQWATTSRNGRIVIGGDTPAFAVFDFAEDRVVFSRPLQEGEPTSLPSSAMQYPPAISSDGRTVLGDWPQTLWDVEAGAPLWKARSLDFAIPDLWFADPASVGTRFVVQERWQEFWKDWVPGRFYTTLAYRDARDGSLLFRVQQTDDNIGAGSFNADWTLVVATGSVYRLPPRVNWPLLAFCQLILASPIVMLWAILRWRKRLRSRKAVAP
jgi:hypothetical protein